MYVVYQAPSAAAVTVAAGVSTASVNTGIFNVIAGEPGAGSQLLMSLPGSGRFNGQPFRVRAAGYLSIAAGTFTTSIQPLLYASTTAGFTAAAANAIYSAAAQAVTISSASAKVINWSLEVYASGDTTSGLINGFYEGSINNGAIQLVDLAVLANAPTSINFSTEPPLQFAMGVSIGTTSNTFPLSNITSTLTQFLIEE
jgi:hypothetical protein